MEKQQASPTPVVLAAGTSYVIAGQITTADQNSTGDCSSSAAAAKPGSTALQDTKPLGQRARAFFCAILQADRPDGYCLKCELDTISAG